jgi:glutamate racemase
VNKYAFYPLIGDIIKDTFSNEGELIDSMVKVIDEIERRWE